jgi:hypothetical protein
MNLLIAGIYFAGFFATVGIVFYEFYRKKEKELAGKYDSVDTLVVGELFCCSLIIGVIWPIVVIFLGLFHIKRLKNTILKWTMGDI